MPPGSSPTIQEFRVRAVRVPMTKPHQTASGMVAESPLILTDVLTDGGISVDQVLAARHGQDTVQPSLVLACEQPLTGYHETNFSMAYSSHISWQSADSPVPVEVYPALAFDSLFENSGSRRLESILDRVSEEAAGRAVVLDDEDGHRLAAGVRMLCAHTP